MYNCIHLHCDNLKQNSQHNCTMNLYAIKFQVDFTFSTKPSQPTHGLVTSFSSLSTESRLKPPPAAINFERKTIKLSSSSSSNKNDSIKINTVIARKKSSDSESSLTSPKPISPSTPKSPRITAPADISGAKKTIKLINRYLSSDDAKSIKIDGANQKMQNSNGDQDIEVCRSSGCIWTV